ncbi:MAG TPA: ribosome small subunit-dependent GTPase A [Holophaga sp.]|nr:ribosome small subunit-dependent GTPase A [Holophaga sp.]
MPHSAHSSAGFAPVPSFHFESLAPFGWTSSLAEAFWEYQASGAEPGRVVAATRGLALVQTLSGEVWCAPSGKFRERLRAEELTLCAGDWIALRWLPDAGKSLALDLLPRGPSLSRREAGPGGRRQWLASNLDAVLLLMGLDRNFNPARLERLLALAWGSGARPVVVLTKADLEARSEAFVSRIEGLASGAQVLAVSARTGDGLAEVRACLPAGRTGVMVGSSGVGKSTLLNALAGEELRRTQEVRASDDRGRHTTSLRELFLLPGAGCLIDTPGIREVGLSAEGSDLDGAFADIAAYAAHCRFRDCAHGAEPGCAVQGALADGLLDPEHYGNYLRLRREVDYEAARSDERLWREREQKWRTIAKSMKHFKKG